MSVRASIIAATSLASVGATYTHYANTTAANLALQLLTGLLITIAVALVGIRTTGMFGMLDETIALSSF
jgi:hypothetical protein